MTGMMSRESLDSLDVTAAPPRSRSTRRARDRRHAAATAGGRLAAKIGALGGVPIIWPAIVILPPPDRGALERAHATLGTYDIAIFVSVNAVEYGAPAAAGEWPARSSPTRPGPERPRRSPVRHSGCAGPADVARQRGTARIGRLADVTGKRIVDFSRRRRARVPRQYAARARRERRSRSLLPACCAAVGRRRARRSDARRSRACADADVQRRARQPARSARSCRSWLVARLPVFAAHPRIAERAREHGLRAVETAGGDAGLLAGLLEWFARPPRNADRRSA